MRFNLLGGFMHIILSVLGTIITILWLLHRLAEMGVTLGGLNPFLWRRRRTWKKLHDANPIFKITSPLEATALLLTATVKAEGDMTSEDKAELLSIFENEFHLSAKESQGLLVSSCHLLGKGDELQNNLKGVLKPSLESFSDEQAESAITLLNRVGSISTSASETQQDLIDQASKILTHTTQPTPKWT